MAFAAIKWAQDIETPSVSSKLALVLLAIQADDRGASFPSLGLLAKRCGCCLNTVRAMLRELQRTGLLFTARRLRADGGTSSNEYVLLYSEAAAAYASSRGWIAPADFVVPAAPAKGNAPAETPPMRKRAAERLPVDWQPGEDLVAFGLDLGFERAELLGAIRDEFVAFWTSPDRGGKDEDGWTTSFRQNLQRAKARRGRPRPMRSSERRPLKRDPFFEQLQALEVDSGQAPGVDDADEVFACRRMLRIA